MGGAAVAEEGATTYNDHVAPIFRAQCLLCHNPDKAKGGLDLSTYRGVMAGGSGGQAAIPGDPGASSLYLVMDHQREPFMPEDAEKRPPEEIETVRRWIEGGLMEHPGDAPKKAAAPAFDLTLKGSPLEKPEGPPPMPEAGRLEPFVRGPRPNTVLALAASPWAPVVAVGGHAQVVLVESESFDPLDILEFPEGVPHVVAFSGNGSLLLGAGGVGAQRGVAVLWDVARGERIQALGDEWDAVLAADVSGDQQFVAIGGSSKRVKILATGSGETVHNIKKHNGWITALKFSPDAILLASGDRNGGLVVWEAETGMEFHDLRGHSGAITGLGWRRDGNVLASASEDGSIRLWDMHKGKQIKNWTAHGGGVLGLDYGKEGTIVSVGRDKAARIWDGNGSQQREITGFADLPTRCALHHDGARLMVGDWTGMVTVWNVADGARMGEFSANPPTLQERVDIIASAATQARSDAEQQRAAKNQADATKAALAAELATLQENQRVAEENRAQAEQKLADMRKQSEDKGVAVNGLRQERESMGAELNGVDESMAQTQKQIEELTAMVAELQAKRDDLSARMAESEKHVAEMEIVIAQLTAGVGEAETAFTQAEEAFLVAGQAMPAKQEAMTQAEAEVTRRLESLQAAEAVLQQHDADLARWQAALEAHIASQAPPEPIQDWNVESLFAQSVWPVFADRCVSCHGPEKIKGDLRLDSRAGVMKSVNLDQPDASELLYRVTLPHDDPDVMPSKGDLLAAEQVEAIRTWVMGGAVFD